jgi:hypothetical protein
VLPDVTVRPAASNCSRAHAGSHSMTGIDGYLTTVSFLLFSVETTTPQNVPLVSGGFFRRALSCVTENHTMRTKGLSS